VTPAPSEFVPEWVCFADPPPWAGCYPQGLPGRCFINAYRLTRCYSELRYVEGVAIYLWDFKAHAWCVTEDGEVIDSTWLNKGFAYEGIVFPRPLINRIVLETGFWDMTALDWLDRRAPRQA
jgi:hypothetical protein